MQLSWGQSELCETTETIGVFSRLLLVNRRNNQYIDSVIRAASDPAKLMMMHVGHRRGNFDFDFKNLQRRSVVGARDGLEEKE